jgi:hypothetical protein
MYFPWNWEFGSALSKLQNFGGGGVEPPNAPSVRHWSETVVRPTKLHGVTSQTTRVVVTAFLTSLQMMIVGARLALTGKHQSR